MRELSEGSGFESLWDHGFCARARREAESCGVVRFLFGCGASVEWDDGGEKARDATFDYTR